MDRQIRTIGMVGTGMIASSMAVLVSGHGMRVKVLARSEGSKQRCLKAIEGFFDQLVSHGLMTTEQADMCRSYISFCFDYSGLADAETVFESVVEDAAAKHTVYGFLAENCPHLKAICSVSSSILPSVLAEGAGRYADRVIVTHPFNPPHLVPYFELCGCDRTADGVMDYAVALLKELDRMPVVLKKPTPGFIGNRLQFALWREALALVEEGICEPRDIDTCLAGSFCPRFTSIGIFEHFDNGGMSLNSSTCRNVFPILSKAEDIPQFMKDLMAEGRMGAASEKHIGFYDWNGADMNAYSERVFAPYLRMFNWTLPDKKDTDGKING